MLKNLFFLFLFSLGFSEEIEVRLQTASDLKPVYISFTNSDLPEMYVEELRTLLEFDLKTGGFVTPCPFRKECEQMLDGPKNSHNFSLSFWRREKIPYVLTLHLSSNGAEALLFNVDQGSSKRYAHLPLNGALDHDRKTIHKISDMLHKDLFGKEGIASLRILYSQRNKQPKGWVSEIWMQDGDGANTNQLTFENSYCITPTFYPHTAGLKNPFFLFVSYKTGQSKIYRSSLQHKNPELVLDLRGSQLLPSLNLEGTQMAFITDAGGRPDLFIQSLDHQNRPIGKSRQLYSAPRATQASSTFSPDGKKIAFVSDKDGPPRIYCMNTNAEKRPRPQLLTKKNRENISPSWSPDGKKLAFSTKVEGTRQIWIYDFETGEESPLTFGPENKENPAWAPDSLHLVFNTDHNEQGELYLIDLHQKQPIQISKGPGQKRFASWETRQ